MTIRAFQYLPVNLSLAKQEEKTASPDPFAHTSVQKKTDADISDITDEIDRNRSTDRFSPLDITNSINNLDLAIESLLAGKSLMNQVDYLSTAASDTSLSNYDRFVLQNQLPELQSLFKRISNNSIRNNGILSGTFQDVSYNSLRLPQAPNNDVFYVVFATNDDKVASLLIQKVRKHNLAEAEPRQRSTQYALSIPQGNEHSLGNYAVIGAMGLEALAAVTESGSGKQSNNFTAQRLTLQGRTTRTTSLLEAGLPATDIIFQINKHSNDTKISASATTTAVLENLSRSGTISFNLYGDNRYTPVSIQASVETDDLSNLATAINNQTSITGISAIDENDQLILRNTSGSDIAIADFQHSNEALQSVYLSSHEQSTRITTERSNDSATVGGLIRFNSQESFIILSDGAQSLLENKSQSSIFESILNIDLNELTGVEIASQISQQATIRIDEIINGQNKTELGNTALKEKRKQILDLFGSFSGTTFNHFQQSPRTEHLLIGKQLSQHTASQITQNPQLALGAISKTNLFKENSLLKLINTSHKVDFFV